jgi:hypothetical protein
VFENTNSVQANTNTNCIPLNTNTNCTPLNTNPKPNANTNCMPLNTNHACSIIRMGNLTLKFIAAEIELQKANTNLLLVYNQYKKVGFSQLRGYIFEALHTGTFNINASLKGSALYAIQTNRVKNFSGHAADILITTKKTITNFKYALDSAPKHMLAQLKTGAYSIRALRHAKYNDMQKVSDVVSNGIERIIKCKNITSEIFTIGELTKITNSLQNATKINVMSRMKIISRLSRSLLSKPLLFLALGESTIRNGHHVYTGKQSFPNAIKEITFDLCFVNDAKAIYNWYNSKNISKSNSNIHLDVNFLQQNNEQYHMNTKLWLQNNEQYPHYNLDFWLQNNKQYPSNTNFWLQNNKQYPSNTNFWLQNNKQYPLNTNFWLQNNEQYLRYNLDFWLQNNKQSHINEFDFTKKKQNIKILPKTTPLQPQNGAFAKHCANVGQQVISSALISITNKLVRYQPIDKEEIIETTASGILIYTGSCTGTKFASGFVEHFTSCSDTISKNIGSGIGTGIAIAVIELSIASYKKKSIMNLEQKDFASAGIKGTVGGISAYCTEVILNKSTNVFTTFCKGGILGAVVNVGFGCYAMYETRTKKDYDMTKWTWLSVASAGVKGTISTGACLAVVSVVAAANWWNPVGWILGIGAAVVVNCGSTYIEEKCSDNFGQRKKHMDHCCEILCCSNNISKKEFITAVRRQRAKFHPDKGMSDNTTQLIEIQECIDAYCMLRKWDSENLFTNKDTISTSWSRKLFKTFYNFINERFRAIFLLSELRNFIKNNKCFVNQIIMYSGDDIIPDHAMIITGCEEFEKINGIKIRAIYSKEEYKEYAMTSFNVTLDSKNILKNISCSTDTNTNPIRTVMILDYKPTYDESVKNICKISSNFWLVGLIDANEEILNNIAENHESSAIDDID